MRVMDELFADFTGNKPGAAVLLLRPELGTATKCFGLANLETGACCTPQTNFRLASLSKQFTALTVVLLAAEGKLSLDHHAGRYLPELTVCGGIVTIRHLLAHQSGLRDYEELIGAGAVKQLKDRDVLELLRREELLFAPGTRFRYSNGGYALLALIVERVSGKTFARFLRDRIFAPLGMENTVAYEAGVSEIAHRAIGYTKRDENFEATDQSVTSAVLGDGGIYSSVADLSLWLDAIATGKLAETRWWRQIFNLASTESDFPPSGYGFGWYIDAERIWHYGATCGFSTWLEWHPKKQFGVVILTNRSGLNLEPIAKQLAAS